MKNSKTTFILKEFTLPVAIVVVILLGFFLVLIPKFKQISELRQKVDLQKKTVNQLNQKVADLKTLSEAELFDSYTLLVEALPGEEDFYRVVMMSKKIFEKNNVNLSSFKFSPGTDAGSSGKNKALQGPQEMTVDVSFFSSFDNLKRMFTEVNNMLPLTEIESLKFGELVEATESGSLLNMNGKLSLVTYWAPLLKTLDKPEKPLPKISTQDRKLIEQLRGYLRFENQTVSETSSGVSVGRDNPF